MRTFIPAASHSIATCPSVCWRSWSDETHQTLSGCSCKFCAWKSQTAFLMRLRAALIEPPGSSPQTKRGARDRFPKAPADVFSGEMAAHRSHLQLLICRAEPQTRASPAQMFCPNHRQRCPQPRWADRCHLGRPNPNKSRWLTDQPLRRLPVRDPATSGF